SCLDFPLAPLAAPPCFPRRDVPARLLSNGAPPSSRARSGVRAACLLGTCSSDLIAASKVPRSPGWIGLYSPFGHQLNAAELAVNVAAPITSKRPTGAPADH